MASIYRAVTARGIYLSQDRSDIQQAVKELSRSMEMMRFQIHHLDCHPNPMRDRMQAKEAVQEGSRREEREFWESACRVTRNSQLVTCNL